MSISWPTDETYQKLAFLNEHREQLEEANCPSSDINESVYCRKIFVGGLTKNTTKRFYICHFLTDRYIIFLFFEFWSG